MLTAKQLKEISRTKNGLHVTFLDPIKAFGITSENTGNTWLSLGFISKVRKFQVCMQANVQIDRQYSEPFTVTNVVKQGCVITPTLFSMMFSPCSLMLLRTAILVPLSAATKMAIDM